MIVVIGFLSGPRKVNTMNAVWSIATMPTAFLTPTSLALSSALAVVKFT